jgi:hypothetical protein
MATRANHDDPALGILIVTIAAVLFGLAIVALQEWTPLLRGLESAIPTARGPESTPASGVCLRCGVIESVRSMDKAELRRASGVTVRGSGDELMLVLSVVAAALVGNRLRPEARAATLHEVTVRFEDGSSRVVESAGASRWERGDRVKVIHGRIHPNG